MWLSALLLVSVLLTSILSGILGMAGGMILMAILVSTVSVATAMMIHGVVQATSNGSRAWLLRSHIQWRILPTYIVGSGAALAGFMALTLVPDPDDASNQVLHTWIVEPNEDVHDNDNIVCNEAPGSGARKARVQHVLRGTAGVSRFDYRVRMRLGQAFQAIVDASHCCPGNIKPEQRSSYPGKNLCLKQLSHRRSPIPME